MSELDGAQPAVAVRGLVKSYGSVHAVRGLDFQVQRGQIYALLGPNGAGKTTTVEILEGYQAATGATSACLALTPAASARG